MQVYRYNSMLMDLYIIIMRVATTNCVRNILRRLHAYVL